MTVNNVNALLNFTTPQTGQTEQTAKQDGNSFGRQHQRSLPDGTAGGGRGYGEARRECADEGDGADAAQRGRRFRQDGGYGCTE